MPEFCQFNDQNMEYSFSEEFAKQADEQDPLKAYREQYLFPQHNGEPCIYFTGNSLGLQPKTAKAALEQELDYSLKSCVES